MPTTKFTDRSRIETYQRCARLRWLSYHEAGLGLAPAKESLPLAVGKSVHRGLEALLRYAALTYEDHVSNFGSGVEWPVNEDQAVEMALADFAPHRRGIALDLAEETAMAVGAGTDLKNFDAQLIATATELGMDPSDPALRELVARQKNSAAEFDDWLWQEQAALVEGMVRAYARRRLRPLLEEFEVLEVEREGDWQLAEWPLKSIHRLTELRFMSRPDALLRSRADNSLYLLSYKTAASWDVRKARDAEHDMQGLSEGVEVERRLGEWWAEIHKQKIIPGGLIDLPEGCTQQEGRYLCDLAAPPRILGIRYEYLLKHSRYADKDLSARFGLNVWAQRSPLIRAYYSEAADQWCWSYDHLKDDGSSSKLYYKTWRPRAVWESMPVRRWIDMLDTATMAMSAYDSTVGMEPREMGWKSDAQAQGFTAHHPLDEVFPAPLTVYRSDDQLRDWVEQVEAQERRVAEAVARVDAAAGDEGEKRHLLNVLMPMSRRACSYPTECQFTRVCYGGEDAQRDPLATGAYKAREPHHTPEKAQVEP
jgi:hypothetical protein